MKLIEFNPDVVPANNRSSNPKIGFQISGLITLNKTAQKLLGVKEGDTVKLFQSDEDAADWYVAKAKGGFALRKLSGAAEMLAFSCKYIKDKVFASVESEKVSGTVPIKEDAVVKVDGTVKAYLIITAALKK